MPTPQLLIGLYTEGTTDTRFLTNVVKKTFEEVCIECPKDMEILDILPVKVIKSSFVEDVMNASRQSGITVLCVHVDADDSSDEKVYRNKITPALLMIEKTEDDICKTIVPIVPVQMTEAWMLSDKALLKKEIGTNMTDRDLGIDKEPERYSDPKETIKNAIRIAQRNKQKRHRRDLNISDLYMSTGQSVSIEKLKRLPSYNKFQDNIRNALRKLNYL
jgi:hypothetical protein